MTTGRINQVTSRTIHCKLPRQFTANWVRQVILRRERFSESAQTYSVAQSCNSPGKQQSTNHSETYVREFVPCVPTMLPQSWALSLHMASKVPEIGCLSSIHTAFPSFVDFAMQNQQILESTGTIKAGVLWEQLSLLEPTVRVADQYAMPFIGLPRFYGQPKTCLVLSQNHALLII